MSSISYGPELCIGTCGAAVRFKDRVHSSSDAWHTPAHSQQINKSSIAALPLTGCTCQEQGTLPKERFIFCSDSTTVLQWLQSNSCRHKVFVGIRIAETRKLTNVEDWRYVERSLNPADNLTRGKTLSKLMQPQRWTLGPSFFASGQFLVALSFFLQTLR